MLAWHVIHTKPARETLACVEISRLGMITYLPLEQYNRTHNHRREVCTRALFPRYIFVQFDHKSQPWGFLKNVRGVCEILCSLAGNPASVPNQVIEAIRNRPLPEPSISPKYQLGQKLRVIDGALAGYEGLYQGSPHERITALLDILGRKVEIPLAVVSAA